MNKHLPIYRFRKTAYSSALALLMICGLLAALRARRNGRGRAALLQSDGGQRQDPGGVGDRHRARVVGFNLYRSRRQRLQRPEDRRPVSRSGAGLDGAKYSYTDTDVLRGVRYYYSLEDDRCQRRSQSHRDIQCRHRHADSYAYRDCDRHRDPFSDRHCSATATRPPTSAATNVPGGSSGDPPTAHASVHPHAGAERDRRSRFDADASPARPGDRDPHRRRGGEHADGRAAAAG